MNKNNSNSLLASLKRQGITRHLLSFLFIFGAIPLIVISLLFLQIYINAQIENTMHIQSEIANRLSVHISSQFEKTIEKISFATTILHLGEKDCEYLNKNMLLFLEKNSEFDEVTLIYPNGTILSKISRFHTFRNSEFNDQSNKDSFKSAMSGNIHISKIAHSQFTRTPQIKINIPIKNEKETITGVLEVVVNIDKLWSFISKFNIGKNRYAYIVDGKGILIAYKDISTVLQKKDVSNIEGVKKALNNDLTTFEYKGLQNENVIGSVNHIPLTNWYVFVEVPVSIAYKDIYLLSTIFFIFIFITVFSALYFQLFLIFKKIILPIQQLEKEAENISKGDFSRRIDVKGKDELGQLAESFNNMITALKKTTVSRDMLKESEERLKSTLEHLQAGILLIDGETHEIIDANPLALKMIGLPREKVIGKECHGFVCPELKGHCLISDLGEKIIQKETVLLRYDGTQKSIIKSVTPVIINGREVFVESFVDITERKKAEQLLRESEERHKAISGLTSDFAYSITITKLGFIDFKWIAGAVEEITGYSNEELSKKGGWNSLIHPGDKNILADKIIELVKGNEINVQYRIIKKDETIIWMNDFAKPISCDMKTGNTYVYGAVKDITEQVESNKKIKKQKSRAELYLDILGHDMGNINQGIISFLELTLLTKTLDEKTALFVKKALQQSHDMTNLSNNVKKLATLEDSKMSLEPIDAHRLLIQAIDRVKNSHPDKEIEINLTALSEDALIKGNVLIEDVFANIIGNAIKYNRKEKKVIDIILSESKEKNTYLFEFRDYGQGISNNSKKKVFKRLERGDESVHGTGLGLAIVKSVIALCKGTVQIQDRVKGDHTQGANFIVTLPKAD